MIAQAPVAHACLKGALVGRFFVPVAAIPEAASGQRQFDGLYSS